MDKKRAENPIVLSFEDSLVRESDLLLLNPPQWLNDTIITFYFEYLKKTYEEAPHLVFIPPEVTQCLSLIPLSQYKVFLEPLQVHEKKFFVFALNNNTKALFAGGTHWSLLLFSRPDKTVYHYDSLSDTNASAAEELAEKLCAYFGFKGNFLEPYACQQDNGYDCGIHLICNADLLAEHLSKVDSVAEYENDRKEIAKKALSMRVKIRQIIEELRKSSS